MNSRLNRIGEPQKDKHTPTDNKKTYRGGELGGSEATNAEWRVLRREVMVLVTSKGE